MSNVMYMGFPRFGAKFTYGGGSWEVDRPITNANNDVYARVARSADLDAESTQVILSSPDRRPVRLIGIFAHNMTLAAGFRITCLDDTVSPAEVLFQSEIEQVWEIVFNTVDRLFETENWFTGQYAPDELVGQIPSRPYVLPDGISPSKIIIEFFDVNNPAGFIDIGLIDVAGAIELQDGERPELGAEWGYESKSNITMIDGGLQRAEIYDPSYVFRGVLPLMTDVKAKQLMQELARQYGRHRPFMWIPYPEDRLTYLRESKMVLLSEDIFNTIVSTSKQSVPLSLREWKG
jgi:hypothetical protein